MLVANPKPCYYSAMIKISTKLRRFLATILALVLTATWLLINPRSYERIFVPDQTHQEQVAQESTPNSETQASNTALSTLAKLEIKGRAPKTGYLRSHFYKGWPDVDGCSLRHRILKREFGDSAKLDEKCHVIAGEFIEPYTGKFMKFTNKTLIARAIQIDHVVALSDTWQKGAQNLTPERRFQLATDPLNLIAADGPANMQKGDGDAATWLPKNKKFRCQYVARQISVKFKYQLWVTQAEHDAMARILKVCPKEPAVGI